MLVIILVDSPGCFPTPCQIVQNILSVATAQGRTRQAEARSFVSPDIGCKLVEEAFETLRDAARNHHSQIEERCDELMNRFRDSAGLLLRTLSKDDMRAGALVLWRRNTQLFCHAYQIC
jgi:hypothetical protein